MPDDVSVRNGMELQKLYHRDFVEISFDASNRWIHADWKGYQSDDSVKEGCELILEALTRFDASRVFNDNRRVVGIWTGVAEWIARDWFPRMRAAGMKKLALVYSPSRLSQISADAAMLQFDPEGRVVAGFFAETAATSWLTSPDSAIALGNETSESLQR